MAANTLLYYNVYQIEPGPKDATTGQVTFKLAAGKQPRAIGFPSNVVSLSEVIPGQIPGLPYIYGKIVADPFGPTPTQEFYTSETVRTLVTQANA